MAIGSAIIAGASSVLGNALGVGGQVSANKTNIKLAEQARQHDIEMFNLQNEYNTPQAQMMRLKEAGLNPNLVYGNGATTLSATPKSSPVPQVQNTLASLRNIDLTPVISMYQDWQVKKAQISNMQAQRAYTEQQTINSALEQSRKAIDIDTKNFNLGQAKRLADTQFEAVKANLQKTLNDINVRNANLALLSKMNTQNIVESNRRIDEIKQRTTNLKTENQLKGLELQLQEKLKPYGMTQNDSFWIRQIVPFLFKNKDEIKLNVERMGKTRDWRR